MIKLTDNAKKRIRRFLEADGNKEGTCFRIAVAGVGASGYQYDFSLDEERYIIDSDVVTDEDGIKVIIDRQSSEKLQGSTVDWAEDEKGSGRFHIENPNNPQLDTNDPDVKKIQELIETEINPAIASHGGFVEIIDYQDGRLFLQMGGGCQGCGQASATMRNGIELLIKESVPNVKEIVDTTDHAAGTNPYYSE